MRMIKCSSQVGKNVDYMENLKFHLAIVSIFTCNCNVILKRSLLFSEDEISTRFNELKFQPRLKSPYNQPLNGFIQSNRYPR